MFTHIVCLPRATAFFPRSTNANLVHIFQKTQMHDISFSSLFPVVLAISWFYWSSRHSTSESTTASCLGGRSRFLDLMSVLWLSLKVSLPYATVWWSLFKMFLQLPTWGVFFWQNNLKMGVVWVFILIYLVWSHCWMSLMFIYFLNNCLFINSDHLGVNRFFFPYSSKDTAESFRFYSKNIW